MANENFTSDDHSWTVRYGFPPEDVRWTEFYGDEYNWTSLVPLLWQSLEAPAARILPPKLPAQDLTHGLCAWWNAPLHLLAFGMGWTDMAKGLREWRLSGYRRDNAVLRLLFDTYGSSIEALEHWLYKGYLDYSLGLIGGSDNSAKPTAEEFRDQQTRLTSMITSGPRHQLTRELIDGNDTFHLSGHFPGSFGNADEPLPTIDADLSDDVTPQRQIRVRLYRSWHRAVSEHMRNHEPRDTPDAVATAVLVSRLGYLGTYSLSPVTGKVFRRSPQTDYARDHSYHLMGN